MLADHLGTRILGSVRVNLRNLRHLMPSWLPLRCHSVGLLRQLSPAVLAAFRQQHFHGRSPRPWESGGDGALVSGLAAGFPLALVLAAARSLLSGQTIGG